MENLPSSIKSQTAKEVVDNFRNTVYYLSSDFQKICAATDSVEESIMNNKATLNNIENFLKSQQDIAALTTKRLEELRDEQSSLKNSISQSITAIDTPEVARNPCHELVVKFMECNDALIETNKKIMEIRNKMSQEEAQTDKKTSFDKVVEILNHQAHSLHQLYNILETEETK